MTSPSPQQPPQPFSLLLPVYRRDSPAFLRRAFASATHEQTRPPAEVVLVRDGPVPDELAALLDELTATSSVPVVRVDLPVNRGLAVALEAGLARCTHEIVARMDADDVSLPHRFAVQLPLLDGEVDTCDVVGSALEEFSGGPSDQDAHDDQDDDDGASGAGETTLAVRTPPAGHDAIAVRARFHSPFNHPTVVYRRSAVARAGGYRDLPLLEDYWLFTRMIATGSKAANVQEPLVRYRVGAGAYARRGGLRLLRSELELQRHLLAEGFTTPAQFARNVVVRGGYRAVPQGLRRLAYRAVFTRRPPSSS
ncbi:Glycosyltransferase involved in cell wall bisynthesis [Quadrisphaera granulorum]|uniref:Glycosyltransferase involved in cell wall biosynthesis n=1 Tax=Quadrisphaera granulorum TaxID=317664 RepID=A0A316ASF4_9ACTN|nr:glycosyltransferase [Quadrisphaera granulorum]PWJ53037.1 glycosyltransferase involved in cell wall biosynthesis [Quadrisphaera granulorum]SZE97202.1 Glycosyltransferase involved in cell wall bisynthesis [Quadrisphaera granulorum]